MNILHMKYAIEVAKAGSINKASEELFDLLNTIKRIWVSSISSLIYLW